MEITQDMVDSGTSLDGSYLGKYGLIGILTEDAELQSIGLNLRRITIDTRDPIQADRVYLLIKKWQKNNLETYGRSSPDGDCDADLLNIDMAYVRKDPIKLLSSLIHLTKSIFKTIDE